MKIILSFITIIVLSSFPLYNDKKPFGLRQIFHLFCFLFFGVAGLVQHLNNDYLAPLYTDLEDADYFVANNVIILSILLFEVFYHFFSKRKEDCIYCNPKSHQLCAKTSRCVIFILCFIILKFYLNSFSIINIFLRGGDGTRLTLDKTTALLLRSINYIPLTIAYYYFLSRNKRPSLSVFFIIVLLFFCMPTSTDRLNILPLYLPLFALFFNSFKKYKYLPRTLFLFGATTVYPILGATRKIVSSDSTLSDIFVLRGLSETFATLNFDSYKTLVFVINKKIVLYGQQLLGCIFFMIPRSFWPNKPVGSGYYIAEKYDLGFGRFYNISMNYLGEGYINFGYFGIFIFVIALSIFCSKLDTIYWEDNNGDISRPFALYYWVTVGYLFFLLRGDMLSGTAFYCGIVTYVLIIEKNCFKWIDANQML